MLIIDTTEVYCIQDYHEKFKCDFTKGRTYKVIVFTPKTQAYIRIYGDSNTTLTFAIDSKLNMNNISSYFLTLSELRKQKLEKLKIYDGI